MRVLRYRGDRRALRAYEARRELVEAGLTRRDLVKLGLLTGGGVGTGLLGAERARADDLPPLPPFRPFFDPLPILEPVPKATLSPAPTEVPNAPLEGRTEQHQSADRFPPQAFYATRMRANPNAVIHTDLPTQTVWGFNKGGDDPATSPGPILVLRYGVPTLVRRYNELPPPAQNGGFGVPEVSTHLHNFHSGPDSDGGPCDPKQERFFSRGQYYDYFYNLQYAGWNSTHPAVVNGVAGDPNERLGFLWYHDHRVDHTSENTYKGLVGPALLFDDLVDTGDEGTGLRLPGFKQGFDIPLVLADRSLDPTTGRLAFDTFNTDGVLGNLFLVNGKVQPHLEVSARRYRFRVLVAGPSRFFDLFLTNPDNLSQKIPFWVISNDGNLLPKPIQVTSHPLAVAERVDIIVDFSKINAKRLRLENRLEQTDGRGPTDNILPAGQGDQLLEFRIGGSAPDSSFDPANPQQLAAWNVPLPDLSGVTPRITRTFQFERGDGGWQINGRFMDCTRFRFKPTMNTAERWIIQNGGGGWHHPVHVHLEEFRILSRNGVPVRPGNVQFSRKDVTILADERVELLMRFRDFRGGYPIHCHNTVHEDHQMMLLWNVADVGDNNANP